MITKDVIEEIKKRLIQAYNPVAIYLFGSYAWGTPTEDSDLDLLIVVDKSEEKSYNRPLAGYKALRGLELISKDLIIHTKDEFDRISNDTTTLGHKIKKEGKLLHASNGNKD